ncbi:MAG: metalloprotease PmbA [Proteobacteria bacterium]|nr:metalloprotease PmbA [Pseudomonadota bacterium]
MNQSTSASAPASSPGHAPTHVDSEARLDALAELSQRLLASARARGADQAEVSCSEETGLNVNVRMGEVETVESSRDRGLALTVYFGQRKGSASTADIEPASIEATIEQAIAIARYTEEDPYAGLADAVRMADPAALPELDLWHPWDIDAERAIEIGRTCEQAGRETDALIENSDGASVGSGTSLGVYANSHGFIGRERSTQHSLGCALIAGRGEGMQRDGWYSIALAADELQGAAAIGRKAAQRAVSRLAPRQIATGSYPVLFAAEVARSLIGHLLGAVSGGAVYRRASFLVDSVGTRLFPEWFSLQEQPFLPRGFRSASFDAEGVATRESPLVSAGVLQRYLLSSYSARRLGLQSTGNAGGVHNLSIGSNAGDFDAMLRGMGRGLLVTELMGQGVNTITGDYSRGAAGFWVEDGRIQHPVDGITIAGNLKSMFAAIEAVGSDTDTRSHVRTGSILVGRMTVAGEG